MPSLSQRLSMKSGQRWTGYVDDDALDPKPINWFYAVIPYLFVLATGAVWLVLGEPHKLHLDIVFQRHITHLEWQDYVHPFKRDGNTVENWMVVAVRFASLTAVCLANSFVLRSSRCHFQKALTRCGLESATLYNQKWWTYGNYYMCDLLDTFHAGILSAFVSGFFVSFTKILVGEPRPDFFDRCFPSIGVSNNAATQAKIKQVVDNMKPPIKWIDICEEKNFRIVTDGIISFPSGHACDAMGGGLFIAMYIWGKLGTFSPKHRSQFWRFLAGMPSILLGLYISLSRIFDYRHHPLDVFAGAFIGTSTSLVAYYTYYMPLTADLCHLSYSQMRWCQRAIPGYRNSEDGKDGDMKKSPLLEIMKKKLT